MEILRKRELKMKDEVDQRMKAVQAKKDADRQ